MAEKILKTQEKLGNEVENNLNHSINGLNKFAEQMQIFQNIEKTLKKDIVKIQEKVKSSEHKIKKFAKFVENKLDFIYSLNSMFEYTNSQLKIDNFKFFGFTFVFIYFLTNFESTISFRLILFIFCALYYLLERNIVSILCNDIFYQYFIFYILRLIFLMTIFVSIIIKAYYFKSSETVNYERFNGLKGLCQATPNWMKKYFSKMNNQNDVLIHKFRRLNHVFNSAQRAED